MACTKRSGFLKARSEFLKEVAAEMEAAHKKFPSSDCCLAALTEETGELAKAMLSESFEHIYKEAVQVAAMAARCALEGDNTLLWYRERHGFLFYPPKSDQFIK